MKTSSIVSIYLDAVTSMVIPFSALNTLSFLKSNADSAESRLISALELKVSKELFKSFLG